MADVSLPIHVFAYGSNLSIPRIAARIERVDVVATGTVRGYELRFNKRSVDGSAKANAHRTDSVEHVVWGAVYALDLSDKRRLDRFEGLGRGYFEEEARVDIADGSISAWLYRANPEYVVEGMAPYSWYHRFCLEGARGHGFPDDYLRTIASIPSVPDPDSERHDRESAVLDQ